MPDPVREQAIEWHDRLRHDPSAETIRAFERWRAERPEHGVEFDQQALLVDQIATLGLSPSERLRRIGPARRSWVPAGAAALATAAALAIFILPSDRTPLEQRPLDVGKSTLDLTTPIRLEDGTIVLLAALTRIEPQFDASIRRVELSGGAARFFAVDDAVRPLIVETSGLRVTSWSGVFDVDLTPGAPRVTAIRGELKVVRLSAASQRPLAVPVGKSLTPGDGRLVSAPPEVLGRVVMINADNLSLADLLLVTNSMSSPPIELGDPTLAERRLVGRFDIRDHHSLARKLAAALDLALREEHGKLILSPSQKESGP